MLDASAAAAGIVRGLIPVLKLTLIIPPQLAHAIVHRQQPSSLSQFALLLFALPAAVSATFASSSLSSFLFGFLRALPVYWLSLSASVVAYRLSPFHPLAKYPGPILCRVSRFWATRVSLSGDQHLVSHQLFEQYGDVVRTGPDHLIIRDVSAIPVVLGGRNMWHRGSRESRYLSHHWNGMAEHAQATTSSSPGARLARCSRR
jgi:hypothetical protein